MDFCLSASKLLKQPTVPSQPISGVSFQIRPADLKDIKALAEVLLQSFHSSQSWISWVYPVLKLGIYEDLRTRLRGSSPYYQCLVACTLETEEIIGTAEISLRSWLLTPTRSCYVSNLAVSSPYRRQGIAKQLLLKCEKIASEWNCQTLYLHVLEDNSAAKQLYLSSGYQWQRVENTLRSWLCNQPKRLLLEKKLNHFKNELNLHNRK